MMTKNSLYLALSLPLILLMTRTTYAQVVPGCHVAADEATRVETARSILKVNGRVDPVTGVKDVDHYHRVINLWAEYGSGEDGVGEDGAVYQESILSNFTRQEMWDYLDVVFSWSSDMELVVLDELWQTHPDDSMTYMVVNPTWHIPDSIATRVYLPKLRKDPTVLARSNMRLFTRSGVEINPKLVNFNQYTAENFPFRVKQNPNSANALGRVKFMFPNQFSIYLHDTPHRELFVKDARAFSNGCIRLQEPIELAEVLLKGQVPDPQASIDGWLAAKSERYVYLDQPLPVYIMYRSAWADPDGTIQYRADIYGRDGEVFRALEAKGVSLPDAAQG